MPANHILSRRRAHLPLPREGTPHILQHTGTTAIQMQPFFDEEIACGMRMSGRANQVRPADQIPWEISCNAVAGEGQVEKQCWQKRVSPESGCPPKKQVTPKSKCPPKAGLPGQPLSASRNLCAARGLHKGRTWCLGTQLGDTGG